MVKGTGNCFFEPQVRTHYLKPAVKCKSAVLDREMFKAVKSILLRFIKLASFGIAVLLSSTGKPQLSEVLKIRAEISPPDSTICSYYLASSSALCA